MGLLKSFKKVLKSPIGKAALLMGLGHFGPKMFGADAGFGQWGKAFTNFKGMEPWQQALIVGGTTAAAGAVGNEIEEKTESVVDTSGHEGYLNARKNFVDEWASWYMQQGDDEETAYAKASKAMFNDGGIVGLANGGRIGMFQGALADANERGKSMSPGTHANYQPGQGHRATYEANLGAPPGKTTSPTYVHKDKPTIRERFDDYIQDRSNTLTNLSFNLLNQGPKSHADVLEFLEDYENQGGDISSVSYIRNVKPEKFTAEDWNKVRNLPGAIDMPNQVSPNHPSGKYNPIRSTMMDYDHTQLVKNQKPGLIMSGDVGNFYRKENPEGAINPDTGLPFTNLEWDAFRDETVRDRGYETGRDGPEWRQRGYPSEAAYLLSTSGGGGGGGGGGTGSTEGDYYGFKEWENWAGAPTTPLFGDANQYKALLNRGGRIGLYGGGMGGMNNPMNPMMNKGLGAMGSPGMNPYNQQNLTQQAQMSGQPGGRPPMPGGPTTAQGQGITGTQAAAQIAEKEQDTDLLKLIRMLASLGIPMEQLRGRTKEELVEMMMSIKSRTQPEGREEVVEEEQEEVITAAHGGRIGMIEGSPRGSLGEEVNFMTEAEASTGNPGNAEMYSSDYINPRFENKLEEVQAVSSEPMDPRSEYEEYKIQQIDLEEPVLSFQDWYNMEYTASEVGVAKGGLMRTKYAMGTGRGSFGEDVDFMTEQEASTGNPGNAEMYADEITEEGLINTGDGIQYFISDDQNIEPMETTRRGAGPPAAPQSPGIYDEGQGGDWFNEMFIERTGSGGGKDYMIPEKAKHLTLSNMGYTNENRAKLIESDRMNFSGKFTNKLNAMLDNAYDERGNEIPENMKEFREIQQLQTTLARDLSQGTNESGLNPDLDRDMTPWETASNIVMKRYDMNQGGLTRTRYAMGTEQPIIPSKDGPQIDYRGIGGYQPHGKKEKHDDVRALLAQGEFVVTSDAVKGIGGGDRDVGAKRMYDLMHKYEPIGRSLS